METTQSTDTTHDAYNPIPVLRECGTCKECCNGWLYGEAHGISFFPNHPCHYLDTTESRCGGCTIYSERPAICRDFKCMWLTSQQIPLWMKPDKSKVIVYERAYEDVDGTYKEPGWKINWVSMVECGKDVDPTVLNWMFQQARNNEFNLHYQVKKTDYYMGSQEFHDFAKATGLRANSASIV